MQTIHSIHLYQDSIFMTKHKKGDDWQSVPVIARGEE